MYNGKPYSDFLVHSQRAGVEDEISVMETAGGQPQSQDASLLSEFHHAVFGWVHFTGWRVGYGFNEDANMERHSKKHFSNSFVCLPR